jgi:SAM-dependent methyltransferase
MTANTHTPLLARLKPYAPRQMVRLYHRVWVRPTRGRRISNAWLREHAADIEGHVLSIGSGHDRDKEGGWYRDYFPHRASYTTSEFGPEFGCDLVLDVRKMPEIADAAFDCVYCSGVLEHVDDFQAGLAEITRILRPGGILLLGLPFRQAIHGAPHDYWRFTEHGIRWLLAANYEVLRLDAIETRVPGFPVAYWAKARKQA